MLTHGNTTRIKVKAPDDSHAFWATPSQIADLERRQYARPYGTKKHIYGFLLLVPVALAVAVLGLQFAPRRSHTLSRQRLASGRRVYAHQGNG